MKVMTLVGTRPEIIKLSCVIPEFDYATRHVLVHTGQNYDYELNEIFFEGLELRRPDHFLSAAAGTVAQTKVTTERFTRVGRSSRIAPDYDVDDVASKVVNAILGYTDYVNRTVWRK